MHPAQGLRIAGLALGRTQADNLVGQDRAGSRLLLDNLIAGVAFEPGHKPDAVLVQLVKPDIIQVGPVKDQQIVRLKVQVLNGPAVMGLAVGDQDTLGQHLGQHGMELDGPLESSELGPGKDCGAQVNGGGIDNFDLRGRLGLSGQSG